jgi:tetratricopeptide (TPR) repeat protein
VRAPSDAKEPDEAAVTADVHTAPTVVEGPTPRSPHRDHDAPLTKGQVLGRYVVLDRLGAGGMGVVYAAYDPELNRRVALKLMHDSQGTSQVRMVREAQALARLSHPNVVAVHDVGTVDGRVFVAMELVEGDSLRTWLRSRRRSWREIVAVFAAAGRGLAAAHAAGIVHRDFKPDNVIVGADGRTTVMDFGLARAEESGGAAIETARGSGVDVLAADLTVTGSTLGTPRYMPPEAHHGDATAASDQFSFCVALYEALYRRAPFQTALGVDDPMRWVPAAPRSTGVPRRVWAVVARGLARDPAERYPAMTALVAALERDPSRRRWLAVIAGVVVAGATLTWGVRSFGHARAISTCEAEADAIDDTWNAPRADAVGNAFARTNIAYAADTWARSRARIDRFARAWRDRRTAVCLAADVDDTLPAETGQGVRACLDEQRDQIGALLDELGAPDATLIQRAGAATATLPRLEACDEPSQLRRRAALSVVERAQIREVRDLAWRATAALSTGRYGEALPRAKAAVDSATKLGAPAVLAEAKLTLAAVQHELGKYEEARELSEAAFYGAGAVGSDDLAVRAAVGLVFITGYRLARHAEGARWAQLSQMLVDRLGLADDLTVAKLLNNLAILDAVDGGHPMKAIELFERSLAMRERLLGSDHPEVAWALSNLGRVYEDAGDPRKAMAAHERALAIREATLGPAHPDVALSLSALGVLNAMHGDRAKAVELGRRALAMYETALGPDHPTVAMAANNLGRAYAARKEWAQAIPLHARALAILETALGPDHPELVGSMSDLGLAYEATGDHAKARQLLERTLAILEKANGKDHPDVARTLLSLGEVKAAQHDRSAAELFERAAAIMEKAYGADHPDVQEALADLGDARYARAEYRKATAAYERVLASAERTHATPVTLAARRFSLARALWDGRIDRTRARSLAIAARDADRGRADIERWLASHH